MRIIKSENKTILESILLDVEQINWTSNNVRLKAIKFVADIFNIFSYKYKSYDVFMPMAKEYWFTLIQGSDRHINEIKRQLTSNQILIVKSGLYNKDKRVLSYKFNQSYINNYSINSDIIIIVTSFCKKLENNELQTIENNTINTLKRIKLDETSNDVVSKVDNEELVEIDITNAQFAIAANIIECDELFKELSINGNLYEYVATELNITRKEAKMKMMRVAFDKVKEEQNDIRNLFPVFMNAVDNYKKQNGYKAFSNLLQCTESSIMIDNVLLSLINEGCNVLSVHDSIRCKKSDYNKVLNRIKEIFAQINFKATLKEKNTNTLEVKETSSKESKTSKEVYIDDFVYQHTITDIYTLVENKLKYITKIDINNFRDFKYLTIKELLQTLNEMNIQMI